MRAGLVTHNSAADLPTCIESLIADGLAPKSITVFDNASRDGSPVIAAKLGVRVILSDRNGGFAYGCNRLLIQADKLSPGEPLLLVNPDVRVCRGSLVLLEETLASRADATIVAPRLLNSDHTLQESARRFPSAAVWMYRLPMARAYTAASRTVRGYLDGVDAGAGVQRVDWVTGAAMLCRPRQLMAAGGFDESFFLYVEDLELCLRLSKRGHGVLYEPRAVMVHGYRHQSARRLISVAFLRHVRSILRYYRKHPAELWRRLPA